MYDYYYRDMVIEQQKTNEFLETQESLLTDINEDLFITKNSQGSIIIMIGILIVLLLARNLKRNGR